VGAQIRPTSRSRRTSGGGCCATSDAATTASVCSSRGSTSRPTTKAEESAKAKAKALAYKGLKDLDVVTQDLSIKQTCPT